jgi:hypothetical protein
MSTYHQLEDGRLSSETLKLRKRRNDEKFFRDHIFGGQDLNLDENSIPWILNHIDCFISQSRGNRSVEDVYLSPHACNGHDDEVWDKFGQAIGNLQALTMLRILTHGRSYGHHEGEEVPIPDWERLARILSHMGQKIEVEIHDMPPWAVEEVQALARAIRGHPTITSFDSCFAFPYESTDSLYSALATLPALESVRLASSRRHARPEDESHHESLTEMLRVPSLRSVSFDCFSFTSALCQASANALMEGTAVTKLKFRGCSFADGECATILANAFSRNTPVSHITVASPVDQALHNVLATALPANSTLQHLALCCWPNNDVGPCLPSVFLALGNNTGLKSLKVDVLGLIDESLSTAIKDGLELNETLESLELRYVRLRYDDTDLWCRALSFLRTNKTLKSLVVEVSGGVTESCLSAFRIDIAGMLQDTTSLESLSIQTWNMNIKIKAEEYFVLVTALQHNRTLKTLNLHYHTSRLALTHDEDKQMAVLLKKNYALESFPHMNLKNEAGDVGAILQLNKAGRRYLIEDGSSISKGVDVLSRVNDNINCVFLHLLENPRLCDRSAVEKVSCGESSGSSTSPIATTSVIGKREPSSVHGGKESRRRLE